MDIYVVIGCRCYIRSPTIFSQIKQMHLSSYRKLYDLECFTTRALDIGFRLFLSSFLVGKFLKTWKRKIFPVPSLPCHLFNCCAHFGDVFFFPCFFFFRFSYLPCSLVVKGFLLLSTPSIKFKGSPDHGFFISEDAASIFST